MKFLRLFFLTIITLLIFDIHILHAAGTAPINCAGLPGCSEGGITNNVEKVSANIIKLTIQYVAVFAVIALMCSGILYMLSGGEEEKTKKAKNWIIWSMVAVILSMSAYYIISSINNIKF